MIDDLLDPPTPEIETAPDLAAAVAGAREAVLALDPRQVSALAAAGLEAAEVAALERVRPAAPAPTRGRSAPARPTLTEGLAPSTPALARVMLAPAAGPTVPARQLGAAIARAGIGHEHLVVAVDVGDEIAALVEGLVLGGHRAAVRVGGAGVGDRGVRAGARPAPRITLVTAAPAAEQVVARALVAARATLLARNLANTPSNLKSPQWMAEQATAVAARSGLSVRVRDERALAAEGFGGLLAVGGGSVTPPRLVELGYQPVGAPDAPHVVLVGKGITFDTGGINAKPAEGMVAMRTDMSGSAVVLAVIEAAARLALPVRITALLALAENALGEGSYRPSDVVVPYGGRRTVEITNTDAEGRVVMADALAYADLDLAPDVVVDVATLTGAARVALARSMGALFASDDEVAAGLLASGRASGEPFWRLPLVEEYRPMLESAVADLDNAPGRVGAITAALFLQEFVGQRRWAHLDIAGPGRSDDDTDLFAKGATGYGARALIDWLEGL